MEIFKFFVGREGNGKQHQGYRAKPKRKDFLRKLVEWGHMGRIVAEGLPNFRRELIQICHYCQLITHINS